jgi:acetate CoA/acetoacetate CoA-transferase alpha subunit
MQRISSTDAVARIPTLMIGGFMGVATPENLIDELVQQRKRDLTVIANGEAVPEKDVGKLISAELLAKRTGKGPRHDS